MTRRRDLRAACAAQVQRALQPSVSEVSCVGRCLLLGEARRQSSTPRTLPRHRLMLPGMPASSAAHSRHQPPSPPSFQASALSCMWSAEGLVALALPCLPVSHTYLCVGVVQVCICGELHPRHALWADGGPQWAPHDVLHWCEHQPCEGASRAHAACVGSQGHDP